MKRGLELEYWVIDEAGALTAPSRALAELSFVDREANPSLIEVKTDPHGSLSGLRAQLCDRLDRTLRIARADGRRLAPIGTALDGVDRGEGNCRRVGGSTHNGTSSGLTDAAVAHGLTDRSVRRYLAGFGFQPDEYEPIGRRIDGPQRLSSSRARRIRRRLAAQLEADVARVREEPPRPDELESGGIVLR